MKREEIIDCIKALSKIEGATLSMGGLNNRGVFTENIDFIMKFFDELLNELDEPLQSLVYYPEHIQIEKDDK